MNILPPGDTSSQFFLWEVNMSQSSSCRWLFQDGVLRFAVFSVVFELEGLYTPARRFHGHANGIFDWVDQKTCCDMIPNTALPLDFKCIFPFRDGLLSGLVKYQLNTLKIEVDLDSHDCCCHIEWYLHRWPDWRSNPSFLRLLQGNFEYIKGSKSSKVHWTDVTLYVNRPV